MPEHEPLRPLRSSELQEKITALPDNLFGREKITPKGERFSRERFKYHEKLQVAFADPDPALADYIFRTCTEIDQEHPYNINESQTNRLIQLFEFVTKQNKLSPKVRAVCLGHLANLVSGRNEVFTELHRIGTPNTILPIDAAWLDNITTWVQTLSTIKATEATPKQLAAMVATIETTEHTKHEIEKQYALTIISTAVRNTMAEKYYQVLPDELRTGFETIEYQCDSLPHVAIKDLDKDARVYRAIFGIGGLDRQSQENIDLLFPCWKIVKQQLNVEITAYGPGLESKEFIQAALAPQHPKHKEAARIIKKLLHYAYNIGAGFRYLQHLLDARTQMSATSSATPAQDQTLMWKQMTEKYLKTIYSEPAIACFHKAQPYLSDINQDDSLEAVRAITERLQPDPLRLSLRERAIYQHVTQERVVELLDLHTLRPDILTPAPEITAEKIQVLQKILPGIAADIFANTVALESFDIPSTEHREVKIHLTFAKDHYPALRVHWENESVGIGFNLNAKLEIENATNLPSEQQQLVEVLRAYILGFIHDKIPHSRIVTGERKPITPRESNEKTPVSPPSDNVRTFLDKNIVVILNPDNNDPTAAANTAVSTNETLDGIQVPIKVRAHYRDLAPQLVRQSRETVFTLLDEQSQLDDFTEEHKTIVKKYLTHPQSHFRTTLDLFKDIQKIVPAELISDEIIQLFIEQEQQVYAQQLQLYLEDSKNPRPNTEKNTTLRNELQQEGITIPPQQRPTQTLVRGWEGAITINPKNEDYVLHSRAVVVRATSTAQAIDKIVRGKPRGKKDQKAVE